MRNMFVAALALSVLAGCLEKQPSGPAVVDPKFIADVREKVFATDPSAFISLEVPGEGSPCTLGSRGYKAGFTSGKVEYVIEDNCERVGIHVKVGPVDHDYASGADKAVVEDGLRSFDAWLDKQEKKTGA